MKKFITFIMAFLVLSSFILSSCNSVKNSNNTQRGTGIGVLAGGILGAVIGNNIGGGGHGALGAAIGAAIGGGTGALIGNKMDKQARQIEDALPGANVERVGEGIKLTLNENAVRFDTNKSTLTTTAKANLDKLVPVFKEYAQTNISIFGYTDSTGKPEYNLALSEQRALAVKSYLESKGIASTRFGIQGMGIADPIASNETPEGKSLNRRVEFAITANATMVEQAKKESGN